jgi:hypothetical protein
LPDKPDRAAAEADLVKALDAKDAWHFSQLSPGGHRANMVVDGGIRDLAVDDWIAWIDNRTKEAHQRYVLARNWIEFASLDALGHDPDVYVRYVVAMARPWYVNTGRQTPIEPDFLARAAAYVDVLTRVFGQAAMSSAAKQLMAAPKDAGGWIAPEAPREVLSTGLITPQYPWSALGPMLGKTSPRNAALALLVWSSPSTPESAEIEYRQLVAKYGEATVHSAAVAVNGAPRREYGEVADPRVIGARRQKPRSTFDDALESRAGANTQPADLVDNPDYAAWKAFPIGRAVLLAETLWNVQNDRLVPDQGTTITLKRYALHSIDAAGVTVAVIEQKLAPTGGLSYPTVGGSPYPARVSRDTVARGDTAPAAMLERGSDTLQLNGTTYHAQWSRNVQHIPRGDVVTMTWTSDEVPGGRLLSLRMQPDGAVYGGVVQSFDVPDLTAPRQKPSDTVAPSTLALIQRAVTDELGKAPELDRLRTRVEARVQAQSLDAFLAKARTGTSSRTSTLGAATSSNRASTPAAPQGPASPQVPVTTIPIGSLLVVSTVDAIDAAGADAGRDYRGVLEHPVAANGGVVLPSGAEIHLKAVNKGATAAAGTVRVGVSAAYVIVDGKRITLTTNELSRTIAAKSRDVPVAVGRSGIRIGGSTGSGSRGPTEIPAHTRFQFAISAAVAAP